ncbi:MAG: hypothetical protein JWR09_2925 [Mucilaginibacter sp.]|nr:hypothetical protein [Mucilaginibacter sp.]
MEDKDEFLKKMENLQLPEIDPRDHPKMVKMAIMNAERSAAFGVWLIILPCYFLLCVLMYYGFHIRAGWFGSMFALIIGLDKTRGMGFLAPVLFFLLPLICIIINILGITHVSSQKIDPVRSKVREFNITLRIKLWNIALILISLAILFAFISFVMTESISIKN